MDQNWEVLYADLIRRLPDVAARAPLTFCGNGACIDARVSLHDVDPMISVDSPEAARFMAMLLERAARGQGGEVTYEWTGGPEWISAHNPISYAMGGTGPQAAWALSAVGAPVLLALEDRSELMLRVVPSDVVLVEDGRLVQARSARTGGATRPPVFIFEYTAGRPIGAIVPERSSRIIVKFGHFKLEADDGFERYTTTNARHAGTGLISGFSSVAADDLPGELARVSSLARAWRIGKLETIHFELSGFDAPEVLHLVLAELRGSVTSIGMSLSELKAVRPGIPDVPSAMESIAHEVGADRICVHADEWAASLTRRDPEVEWEALLTGCLLAASRAAAGRPVLPESIHPRATFKPLPFRHAGLSGPWRLVACASPFLRSPRTTLGLGDTFTGGCLLALGAASAESR